MVCTSCGYLTRVVPDNHDDCILPICRKMFSLAVKRLLPPRLHPLTSDLRLHFQNAS